MSNQGILYIVGTPIGNLEDLTFRALRILQTVDLIAAEDTRHTAKLLKHFEITTPQISYHQHNRQSRHEELIQRLESGKNIALVTDAGMPGISDPGYDLIKSCIHRAVNIIPIPGVTAVITALVGGGLPMERFVFEGFLPTKNKEKSERLTSLKNESRTMIFYEAPHRIQETLKDFGVTFGLDREIVLARELTKLHEEFWRGKINDAIKIYDSDRLPKGEYTLVVAGCVDTITLSEEEVKIQLQELLNQGISRSQASKNLARISNMSRQEIYQLTIKL